MRTNSIGILLVGMAGIALFALTAAAREWTSRSGGFKVEAELVDVKDGNVVLKKEDGTTITVPLENLSLADIRYVKDTLKAAEEEVKGGKATGRGDDAGDDTPKEPGKRRSSSRKTPETSPREPGGPPLAQEGTSD